MSSWGQIHRMPTSEIRAGVFLPYGKTHMSMQTAVLWHRVQRAMGNDTPLASLSQCTNVTFAVFCCYQAIRLITFLFPYRCRQQPLPKRKDIATPESSLSRHAECRADRDSHGLSVVFQNAMPADGLLYHHLQSQNSML